MTFINFVITPESTNSIQLNTLEIFRTNLRLLTIGLKWLKLFNKCPKYFRLPSWTRKIFTPDGDLRKIAHFSYQLDTPNKLMQRLKVGFLIRDMFERFAMKANATLSPDRSIFVYSAHDITIVNLMRALNLVEVIATSVTTLNYNFYIK